MAMCVLRVSVTGLVQAWINRDREGRMITLHARRNGEYRRLVLPSPVFYTAALGETKHPLAFF